MNKRTNYISTFHDKKTRKHDTFIIQKPPQNMT